MKICGLTLPEQAAACAALGAWAVGVVLAEESPRRLDVARAAAVLEAAGDSVARVGVFVGGSPGDIAAVAAACRMTHVQLHGDVDVRAVAEASGCEVIEAIPVAGPSSLERARRSAADLVLLDAAVPGRHGGTGRRVDWALLAEHPLGRPVVLAGGLTPENVGEAVATVRPYAVDVASGVESSPGVKDLDRVRLLIERARAAGRELAR